MKTKHNKKRNTAFIYEALVREIVKQSVTKNNKKRNAAIQIMKESFAPNTELRRELDLYKTLLEKFNKKYTNLSDEQKHVLKEYISNISNYYREIMAIVIGMFLHISTTILFESSEGHHFNSRKAIAIIIGSSIALISTFL